MKMDEKKIGAFRTLMVIIIIVGSIVLVHYKYDWRYLYVDLRLKMFVRSIIHDSLNESLYKERIEFCDEIPIFRKELGLDSILEHDTEKRIQLGTRDTLVYLRLHAKYFASGDNEKALENITAAIRHGAHGWNFARVMTFSRLRMYDSALAYLRWDTVPYGIDEIQMGRYLVMLGRYDSAKAAFRKGNDNYRLAELCLAQSEYKEVLRISASDSIGLLRAIAFYRDGKSSEAAELCLKLIHKDSNDCCAPYLLSKIYLEQDDLPNAMTYLSMSLNKGFLFFDVLESDPSFSRPRSKHVIAPLVGLWKKRNEGDIRAYNSVYRRADAKRTLDEVNNLWERYHRTFDARLFFVLLYPSQRGEFRRAYYFSECWLG